MINWKVDRPNKNYMSNNLYAAKRNNSDRLYAVMKNMLKKNTQNNLTGHVLFLNNNHSPFLIGKKYHTEQQK